MRNRERILAEFQAVPENTLIMTGKLYREKFSEQMSEAAFTQAISRLSKSGEIERISKGIYCKPKNGGYITDVLSLVNTDDLQFRMTLAFNFCNSLFAQKVLG